MDNEIALLSHLLLAAQMSLGIVFLLSALPKIRSPLNFAQNVAEYKLIPTWAAHGLALVLIPLEAFLLIAFLTGWLFELALLFAAGMLILFFIAVGINLRRGRQISCGCFGDSSEQISPRTLVRICLLLAVVLLLAVFNEVVSPLLPPFAGIKLDRSILIYLIQTSFLALFFILIANWLLNWPELTFVIRQGYESQHSPNSVDNTDVV